LVAQGYTQAEGLDIINIDLQHKQVLANLLGEESGVNLAHLEAFRE